MQKTLSLKSNIPEFDYAWIKQDISVWVSLLTGSEKMESQTAAYYKAKIISVNFNTKKVDISFVSEEGKQETKTEILFSNIFQTNETKDKGFNDMVDMENLNEAELLYNIKNRYEKNEIFTYVGPTLLVVNPYQNIPGLIGEECLNNYQKKVYEPSYILKDVEPHVYAISADCVRKLCESKKNQAIVISGESGAGKTENAKLAMKFITSIGNFNIYSK